MMGKGWVYLVTGLKNRMALRNFLDQKSFKNIGHEPIMKNTRRDPLKVYPKQG